jgi:hypothetical protein
MSMSRTITISSWSSANTASLMTSFPVSDERGSRPHVGGQRCTCQSFLVTACEEKEGLGVAIRGTEETLAIRVFADAFEQGSHRPGHLLFAQGTLCRGGI